MASLLAEPMTFDAKFDNDRNILRLLIRTPQARAQALRLALSAPKRPCSRIIGCSMPNKIALFLVSSDMQSMRLTAATIQLVCAPYGCHEETLNTNLRNWLVSLWCFVPLHRPIFLYTVSINFMPINPLCLTSS